MSIQTLIHLRNFVFIAKFPRVLLVYKYVKRKFIEGKEEKNERDRQIDGQRGKEREGERVRSESLDEWRSHFVCGEIVEGKTREKDARKKKLKKLEKCI